MTSEKLFHDWHLPEGMTLVPNAKDDIAALTKLAKEILRQDQKSFEIPEDLDYLDVPKFLRRQKESAGDKPQKAVHTETMNDITREEFNAKLETIETKMDARVESVSAKIDAFLAVQAERDKAADFRFSRIENDLSGMSGDLKTMNAEIKTSISSVKTTTIVTAVSAVLAIVFGIVSFNATLSSNMLSAFQAGKAEQSAQIAAPPAAPPPSTSK